MDTHQLNQQKNYFELINLATPALLLSTKGDILALNSSAADLLQLTPPKKFESISLADITQSKDFETICESIYTHHPLSNYPLVIQGEHRKYYSLAYISPCLNKHLSISCAKLLSLEITKGLYQSLHYSEHPKFARHQIA